MLQRSNTRTYLHGKLKQKEDELRSREREVKMLKDQNEQILNQQQPNTKLSNTGDEIASSLKNENNMMKKQIEMLED